MSTRTFKAGCFMFLTDEVLGNGERAGEGWGGSE